MIKKIIVFGASITSSPWWTWKDFLSIESGLPVIDLSRRGAGNEYMTYSLLSSELDESTLVVGMFTNVDKFDWYVEGDQFESLQNEKHRPISVGENSGFWCTGSWFPERKSLFKEHFFNLDYFCVKSIQQILLIKEICRAKNAPLEIFFDSPIWSYTEQQFNDYVTHGSGLETIPMLDFDLASKWKHLLSPQEIDLSTRSLIGYCMSNDLQWHNQFYKAHPPSSSHWEYYRNIMVPDIQKHVDLATHNMSNKIKEMDKIWKES